MSSKAQACGKVSLCPRGLQVVTVDVRNKKAVFKDGFKLEYSKLLLAPGSRWVDISCLYQTLGSWASARMGGPH